MSMTMGDRDEMFSLPSACCCGKSDCAFLEHSCKLLESVQRDARTAGEMGQALLARHEAYIADAERDRRSMLECIDHLDHEKKTLEVKNTEAIEENRKLLDQLEALNNAVIESDSRIITLTDALRSADQNVERLMGLAARTEMLQEQLLRFEEDQAKLHVTLAVTKEDERTAILRWQKAERTINDMQDQLERIEREAREERDRHVEVMGRMERRRAVEMELQSAAGRLKGAAAAKSMPGEGNGSVVSHFVKDILQDNANLQLGIVELKEMLDRSNEEVERLRVLMNNEETPEPAETPTTPSLGAELSAKELHVHHHYHAPARKVVEPPKPTRKEFPRRPKKKRVSLTPTGILPSHTPRTSISSMHSPTASAILSQTSVSVPQSRNGRNRWSVQSNQTGSTAFSSLPSSPYNDSVFDRVFSDAPTDLSRPTSPESDAVLSPRDFGNDHRRKDSVPKFLLDEGMRSSSDGNVPLTRQLLMPAAKGKARLESSPQLDYESWGSVILEENEDFEDQDLESPSTESPGSVIPNAHDTSPPRDIPRLRRSASHESIISISGVDIHTLQSHPSQLLIGRRMVSSGSPRPVLSGASATATATQMQRSPMEDSRSYLSNLAASQRIPPTLAKKNSMGHIGSRFGGWVTGRWGYTPAPPPPPPPPPPLAANETPSLSSSFGKSVESAGSSSEAKKEQMVPIMRPPGINQKGPIFGFGPEPKLSREVVVTGILDEEALREGLLGA